MWLSKYFENQNPLEMPQETLILVNAYTDGVFGPDSQGECMVQISNWLKYLAQQPGQVVTREILLEKVWGYEYYGDIRTVDVTVRRIREKIEKDTSAPKILITKRGVGYYLATN